MLCFYGLFLIFTESLYAQESVHLSDNLTIEGEFSASQGIYLEGNPFDVKNNSQQFNSNFSSNELAQNAKYFHLGTDLDYKGLGSFVVSLDYLWNKPLNFSLYERSIVQNRLLIKDLYVDSSIYFKNYSYWGGIRTFEFEPLTLLNVSNPFDQVSLQGGGIEGKSVQFSVSLNKGSVNSIASKTITSNNSSIPLSYILKDSNGVPILYPINEYILSAFLSGRLLLKEGRLFEPIFAFRYYFGGNSKEDLGPNAKIYKVKPVSALIVGGVFSRPISYGISGTTTVWFSSLPSNEFWDVNSISSDETNFQGFGRENSYTPRNTIGIMDSSEFYLIKNSGLLSAFYLTNNIYSDDFPVLSIAPDKSRLESTSSDKSDSNYKYSVALEPLFFLDKNFIIGASFQLNYVNKKLFQDDANAVLFSPVIKWVFDEKLNSKQYVFLSTTIGRYDWKIIQNTNGPNTDFIFSIQTGAKLEI